MPFNPDLNYDSLDSREVIFEWDEAEGGWWASRKGADPWEPRAFGYTKENAEQWLYDKEANFYDEG